jgi:hypothetical protein
MNVSAGHTDMPWSHIHKRFDRCRGRLPSPYGPGGMKVSTGGGAPGASAGNGPAVGPGGGPRQGQGRISRSKG